MLWVLIKTGEAILMRTHNICVYGEISKIIPKLSSNTLIICSTESYLSHSSHRRWLSPVLGSSVSPEWHQTLRTVADVQSHQNIAQQNPRLIHTWQSVDFAPTKKTKQQTMKYLCDCQEKKMHAAGLGLLAETKTVWALCKLSYLSQYPMLRST